MGAIVPTTDPNVLLAALEVGGGGLAARPGLRAPTARNGLPWGGMQCQVVRPARDQPALPLPLLYRPLSATLWRWTWRPAPAAASWPACQRRTARVRYKAPLGTALQHHAAQHAARPRRRRGAAHARAPAMYPCASPSLSLPRAEPARRFNDGKVSPAGSLLVGRMHAQWRDGQRGRLYRLDPGSRWVLPWGGGLLRSGRGAGVPTAGVSARVLGAWHTARPAAPCRPQRAARGDGARRGAAAQRHGVAGGAAAGLLCGQWGGADHCISNRCAGGWWGVGADGGHLRRSGMAGDGIRALVCPGGATSLLGARACCPPRSPGPVQGVPQRGPDGALLGRTVVHQPTQHKTVPDGMTIDAGAPLPPPAAACCCLLLPRCCGSAARAVCTGEAYSTPPARHPWTDGNLWVALGESGSVVCYSAETGEAWGRWAGQATHARRVCTIPSIALALVSRRRGAAAGGAAGQAPHRLHLWRGPAAAPVRHDPRRDRWVLALAAASAAAAARTGCACPAS